MIGFDESKNCIRVHRCISDTQSKDYPTPYHSPISGVFLGYAESDEHLNNRIKKMASILRTE